MQGEFGDEQDELSGRIGERIAFLRKKHNLTQEELANLIGIQRATYAHYEQGRRIPDASVILQLSKVFGVRSDYILGYINENNEVEPKEMWRSPYPGEDDYPWAIGNRITIASPEREFRVWMDRYFSEDFYADFESLPDKHKRSFLRNMRVLWDMEWYKFQRDTKHK